MNSLLQLIPLSSKRPSYSVLVDIQQIHARNVVWFCTGLSMARVLFGSAIHCQKNIPSLSQEFADTLCLVNGTMTLGTDSTVYHDYYQWVAVYLLLLGLAFYLPYALWAQLNGSYLRHLETLAEKPDEAIQVVLESKGYRLFWKTWALEMVYALHWILLLALTDLFFNRLWSQWNWSWRTIPLLFPDSGSCFFDYHDSSGASMARLKCLLPLCSVYRKVFFALYLLMAALLVANSLGIVYHGILAVRRRRWIDTWWAMSIVEGCAVSWHAKKKFRKAMHRLGQDEEQSFALRFLNRDLEAFI